MSDTNEFTIGLASDGKYKLFYNGEEPTTDLLAVRQSIRKWRLLANRPVPIHDGAMASCGCCLRYLVPHARCDGCPVITIGGGEDECKATPYAKYARRMHNGDSDERTLDAAREELAFLEDIERQMRANLVTTLTPYCMYTLMLGRVVEALAAGQDPHPTTTARAIRTMQQQYLAWSDPHTLSDALYELTTFMSPEWRTDAQETLHPTIRNTKIQQWAERGRQSITLVTCTDETQLISWWDEAVTEAAEDGFLDPKKLHQSALEYYLIHYAGQIGIDIIKED